jgi:hypothetical protein
MRGEYGLSLFNGKTPSLEMDNLVRFQEGVKAEYRLRKGRIAAVREPGLTP